MSVVWKYELDVRQNQLVQMPIDAQILTLGVQNDFPVLWFLTEGKGVKTTEKIFSVVTTGEVFEWPSKRAWNPEIALPIAITERRVGEHIGTVVLGKDMATDNPSAWYVAHVFQGKLKVLDNKIEDRRQIIQELRS